MPVAPNAIIQTVQEISEQQQHLIAKKDKWEQIAKDREQQTINAVERFEGVVQHVKHLEDDNLAKSHRCRSFTSNIRIVCKAMNHTPPYCVHVKKKFIIR